MRNLHPNMWPIKWRLLAKVSANLLYDSSALQFTYNGKKIYPTAFLRYTSFV